VTLKEQLALTLEAIHRAGERLDKDEALPLVLAALRRDLDAAGLPDEVREGMAAYFNSLREGDPAHGPFDRHMARAALETCLEGTARARGEWRVTRG
jgi:hypothetical protein